ncbi:hypothetical protein V6N13_016573 [Hibiscus sabdariffa]
MRIKKKECELHVQAARVQWCLCDHAVANAAFPSLTHAHAQNSNFGAANAYDLSVPRGPTLRPSNYEEDGVAAGTSKSRF